MQVTPRHTNMMHPNSKDVTDTTRLIQLEPIKLGSKPHETEVTESLYDSQMYLEQS
jgi:hypothetical protein